MKKRDPDIKYRKKLASMAAQHAAGAESPAAFPASANSWLTEIAVDSAAKALAGERQKQIIDALKKLDAGTYGICEECGGTIDRARLDVIPEAPLCVKCQRQQEQKREALADPLGHSLYDQSM